MAAPVNQTCRDITELLPVAQIAIKLFFYECYKAGIKIFVTETYRSQARQDYLYAQGRTRPGNIVTWTRTSRHTSRLAWDIGASTLDGNTNIYNATVLKKAGAIARKLGITWGGDWPNNLDYPHFEVTKNWKMPKGYSLDGINISIPTRSNQPIVVTTKGKLPKVDLYVDDKTIAKEENQMAQKVLLKDISSPTLKTSAIKFIKLAMESGKIQDSKWLKAAEDGTLPIDELFLLYLHANLNGPFIGLSESPTLRESFNNYLNEATEKGLLKDTKWENQSKEGSLSIIDAVLLKNHIERQQK